MIDSGEVIEQISIEINIPLKNFDIHFITAKNWDGQCVKMPVFLFKKLMETYLRILISDELRKDKKILKKIITINSDLKKHMDRGVVYVLIENYDGGAVRINQLGMISEIDEETYKEEEWDRFSYVFIFSMKNQPFSLSLRSTIEAKIIKNAIKNKNYNLLNNKKESEEKIRLAEFQLKEPAIQKYYEFVRAIFRCFGIDLLQ
ncbi:MAG: hypothetical protein ACTSQJ_06255 [Promethearchaeota archaeon]